MEIKVCTTKEWNDKEWNSYLNSFNAVFDRDFKISYFRHKYTKTMDGHSYHALLLNDDLQVVGACSISPFKYKKEKTYIKVGQAVDVFILEEYRTDPLMLRRMYVQLKKLLIQNEIPVVMAVPNATAYPYWKNIVKWRDVGDLSYWILPIRIGNVLKKYQFLNSLSLMFNYLLIGINSILSSIANSKEKDSLYKLVIDSEFIEYRYTEDYSKVTIKDVSFIYRIWNENGVRTLYLFYTTENGCFTYKALSKAVSYIVRNINVDLLLYVGPLRLKQSLLFKVPKRFEPKRLPLTCDILNKDDFELFSDMLKLENWNFGLQNYDVR